MRIYNGVKDYYDTAIAYGIDPNIVFDRKNVKTIYTYSIPTDIKNWIRRGHFNSYIIASSNKKAYGVSFYPIVIGFCGNIFLGYYRESDVADYFYGDNPYTRSNSYDFDLVDKEFVPSSINDLKKRKKYFKFTYSPSKIKLYMNRGLENKKLANSNKVTQRLYYRSDEIRKSYEDAIQSSKQDFTSLFVKTNSPIFAIAECKSRSGIGYDDIENGYECIVNPKISLEMTQFYKVRDAVTAFQEISMYIGNTLFKEPDMDNIDDKYRIGQHGFTDKSFRHPTKLKDL